MGTGRRGRPRWQVVRFFPNGLRVLQCEHRWEVTAGWCADWRDLMFVVRNRRDGSYHDLRPFPKKWSGDR